MSKPDSVTQLTEMIDNIEQNGYHVLQVADCVTLMELARDEILELKQKLLDRQIRQQEMERQVSEIAADYKQLHCLIEQFKTRFMTAGHA